MARPHTNSPASFIAASVASLSANSTCPKPLNSPVSRSVASRTFVISPHSLKKSRTVSSSIWNERLPTNTVVHPSGFSDGPFIGVPFGFPSVPSASFTLIHRPIISCPSIATAFATASAFLNVRNPKPVGRPSLPIGMSTCSMSPHALNMSRMSFSDALNGSPPRNTRFLFPPSPSAASGFFRLFESFISSSLSSSSSSSESASLDLTAFPSPVLAFFAAGFSSSLSSDDSSELSSSFFAAFAGAAFLAAPFFFSSSSSLSSESSSELSSFFAAAFLAGAAAFLAEPFFLSSSSSELSSSELSSFFLPLVLPLAEPLAFTPFALGFFLSSSLDSSESSSLLSSFFFLAAAALAGGVFLAETGFLTSSSSELSSSLDSSEDSSVFFFFDGSSAVFLLAPTTFPIVSLFSDHAVDKANCNTRWW
mmetsp:Transcript_28595/g.68205  ORF Transcript_28595/g.68205 Transcript_28595/m.68205 type:complete len:422 (-) Transcript_28595:7-1272(-)